MYVHVVLTGELRDRELTWPKDWPLPREGDSVTLRAGEILYVRHVMWMPEGRPSEEMPFPYVDLVLGPRR